MQPIVSREPVTDALLDRMVQAIDAFGFHVQQAAEKLLKACIALLGEVYPPTRDIEDLLNLLTSRGAAVESLGDSVDYTPYAVEYRYAGVEPSAKPIDHKGAFALVLELWKSVEHQLAEVEG